ncbi:fasciclin domain-containing protein [Chitinophaga niabensis]|uniref:fasciclin domain-containing protein n=1 Tax=Chitinophaga niabensis TaxID=536979 RepID=UPI0031BABD27
MKILLSRSIVLACIVLTFSCKKKAWDEYYGRPDNLEPPIYQVLESKGNFKTLLAAIDKAGYKRSLGAAGYWTLFAPHDSAFSVYFRDKGISGIEQLDSLACQKIITYCLVYNAFKRERIGDYQSAVGWVPNIAFKRRTANYTGVYDGQDGNGNPIKVVGSNRNSATLPYVDGDNNNKYIPYFVNNFMAAKSLSAADYNYFYPNTVYTGFNVVDAVVTQADIPAENGVVHVINKVITTLPGLDEYISSNPQYSEFKKLFDKFLVAYVVNQVVTKKYQTVTGRNEQVYTKVYPTLIAFSPNNENYFKQQDNDAQADGYSMFVPTNTALLEYVNRVLLEHYTSLEQMPVNIIYDFINAHLWSSTVWPSKFASTFNVLGEEARFDPQADVVDRKILSNGIFYGTNKVQEANVFSSVFGKAYLDPKFSMMTSLLNQELKFQVSNIKQKYSIFMISNDVLNASGYFVDPTVDINPNNQWRYTPPGGGTQLVGPNAVGRLMRVLQLHIIPQVDVKDISGTGVVLSYGGEYVRFENNTVFAAGNLDAGNVGVGTGSKTAKNGTVQYIDRVMEFSTAIVGKHVEKLGTPTTSDFNYFWQYLRNSSIYTISSGEIANVAGGTFYTFLIPDKNAILAAVNAGLLPGTGVAPNKLPLFNPTLATDKELVNKFIYSHILNKRSVATDGSDGGAVETLYRDSQGDPGSVFVDNSVINAMKLRDVENRTADVIYAKSNFLSNRCVIHLINNYLKYKE